jgi:aldehyde dehydrogenase (NAD+)
MASTISVAEIFERMEYGPAPESAGEALRWIEEHQPVTRLFIDGKWVESDAGESFEVLNPATGKRLVDATQGSAEDVDRAVAAARRAFPGWSALSGHVRARYLYALARRIQKHSRLFAVLETLDNGKPIRETRDIDIPLVARHFSHHAGWAQLRDKEFPGYEPVGVVGQIIPWNFPLLMLAWKVAPALAAGNTVVLKPAEYTPLTALLFAEIAEEIGLPPGVLNVVTGDGRTGEALVKQVDVNKIAFTGSTEVGRAIRKAAAGSGKQLSLELGGKSPFVVFEDADIDSVVEGVVDAIWFNQGQVCCAGSRLLAQEGIAAALVEKLKARMEHLRVGDPLDKAIDIGAIVAPVQLERIEKLVALGTEEGAEMWQPSWVCPADGYWYPPTLFTNVAPAATIAQVEIFGPVLVSMTFRTPEEAIQLANNTPYGLAASIWSEDIGKALEVAAKLQAGTVWINSTNLFDAASGFGGYRESGFGREGGREGMYEYLRPVWETLPQENPFSRPQTGVEADGIRPQGDGLSPESPVEPEHDSDAPFPIDRTPKLFIGGKQARPDSGYSRRILGSDGRFIGEVGEGNRKDIRNAVEAAQAAAGWSGATAYNRSQILYYLAENLSSRADEFAARIDRQTGGARGRDEMERAIERLFSYAAWADKFGGGIQATPIRGVTLAAHAA